MRKLLMLGTSEESVEIVLAAKQKGIYTIVTDYNEPENSRAKQFADDYWMISTADIDLLESKCKQEKINAVITGIGPHNIKVSIELCKRLHLPCYTSLNAWRYTIDKRAFKDVCIESGVPVAKDYYVNDNSDLSELSKIEYPVVVKANDQSMNRGMSYCHNASELVAAIQYAKDCSNSNTVIIEHMLEGHEYAARYALADGTAALVDFSVMLNQPGYPSNCYSLTTTCTNNFYNYLNNFDSYFKKALQKMGCREGYAWVELMEDKDGTLNALEMGYRMAGDMFEKQMAKSEGFDAINWMLEIAMGVKHTPENLPCSLTKLPERTVNSYILWSEHDGTISKIEGLDEISKINNLSIEQHFFVGSKVKKHHYMLVITFDTLSFNETCNVIKYINQYVKILDEYGKNLIIYYDDFETLYKMNDSTQTTN